MVKSTIIIIDRDATDDKSRHIPGVHNMQTTLCGYVDVIYREVSAVEYPCDCKQCIDALKRIKALRFPKGYFAEE